MNNAHLKDCKKNAGRSLFDGLLGGGGARELSERTTTTLDREKPLDEAMAPPKRQIGLFKFQPSGQGHGLVMIAPSFTGELPATDAG